MVDMAETRDPAVTAGLEEIAAALLFASVVSPDFATATALAAPRPHTRRAPAREDPRSHERGAPTVAPVAEWRRPGGGAGGRGSPAPPPGKNAWQGGRGTPPPQTPEQKVVTSVRRLMNKLPSTDSVRRSISDLKTRRDELRAKASRGKAGDDDLRATEDRIDVLRLEIANCGERRAKIVAQLTEIDVPDAECAGAFVATFVAAILPASTKTRDDGGERALFEAPAQLCVALNVEGVWGRGAPGADAIAEGEFRWGRARFLGDLRRNCQANFIDASLDNDAFAPHMKLVAYLVREDVLPARRVVPDAEKVLLIRLVNATTPESACECIKLVRLFLEIVAPDPNDKLVALSVGVLRRIAERKPLVPPLKFELPARAVSEAQIYLSAGKAAQRGARPEGGRRRNRRSRR